MVHQREADAAVLYFVPQIGVLENDCPHVHPQKLVVSIHQGQEYNEVEAPAVAKEAASSLWTSDWNMPSIQGTHGMWKVPPPAEDGLDQQPIL